MSCKNKIAGYVLAGLALFFVDLFLYSAVCYGEGKMVEKGDKIVTVQHMCKSSSKNSKIDALLITHIGAIDKPIESLILKVNDSVEYPALKKMDVVREAVVSENEMMCICEKCEEGRLFSKRYDQSFELGSFSFEFIRKKKEEILKANRRDSIYIFLKISECLQGNVSAKKLVENNITRTKY